MDTNNKPLTNEEIIIKRQGIAVIATFVLFFLAGFISLQVTGVVKYGVLGACIPMLYIGASSIKNRISIVRLRGQKGYSRDKRAVILGSIMLILAITYLVLVFIPLL